MIVRVRYRWIYTLLQLVLHTTQYTQGANDSPEESVTTTKPLIANEEVLPTQAQNSDFPMVLNGNISGIRTLQSLHDDRHKLNGTNREAHGNDTVDEITTPQPMYEESGNYSDGDITTILPLDVTKDNETDGDLTTLQPLDVVKDIETDAENTTILPLEISKDNETNGNSTQNTNTDGVNNTESNTTNDEDHEPDNNTTQEYHTEQPEIYDTTPITPLTPTDTKAPATEPQHETTTDVSLVCGINSIKENGSCVCNSGWSGDPLETTESLNCPCKDLCATTAGDTCPQDAVCVMESCNRRTCRCGQGLFYNKVHKSCIGVCEYYGSNLCTGTNERCVPAAEGGFQCHCQQGFSRNAQDCTDIDECSDGLVCQDNEECQNTIGSSLCACKPGFLRATDGKCQGVNECLVPSLHDCDQLCEDQAPPERYVCSCFQGFSWNDSQRICSRDNTTSMCECSDPSLSECVLVQGLSQQKKCYPKPGWHGDDGNVQDVNECSSSAKVDEWCGANSYCMNSVGSASCRCREGFLNTTLNYGQCDAVICPPGQVISGSQCVGACSKVECRAPYKCGVNNDGSAECRCMSECLLTTQPNSPSSIYHGAFTLTTEEKDRETLRFLLTTTLELVFDAGVVEILAVTSSLRSKRQTLVTYDVEFTVIQERGDLQEELSSLLKRTCLDLPSDNVTCALPGGSKLLKDSITLSVRDPCSPSPCPGSLFKCIVRPGAAGRADCVCKDGYFNIPVMGAMGLCEDVDECVLDSHNCTVECINTPGSFVCRDIAPDTTEKSLLAGGAGTHRDLAIAFGVLFFICLCAAIGLACMLFKRNNRTGEMIPMTSNGSVGVDNGAYST